MKKLLIITFVLSLIFFKSQAQNWSDGYSSAAAGITGGTDLQHLYCTLGADVTTANANGWKLIYLDIHLDATTADGHYYNYISAGATGGIVSGTDYDAMDYPYVTLISDISTAYVAEEDYYFVAVYQSTTSNTVFKTEFYSGVEY
jgi:hypothetical protein